MRKGRRGTDLYALIGFLNIEIRYFKRIRTSKMTRMKLPDENLYIRWSNTRYDTTVVDVNDIK